MDNLPSIIPTDAERKQMRAQSRAFLPSIKLIQGISKEINKENHVEAGDFLVSNTNTNLKQGFSICVVGRRSHALLMIDNKKSKESFNFESPVFKEIQNTKSDRDAGINAFWGDDFLIWIPKAGEFYTLFCGKPSNRETGWCIVDHMTPLDQREKGREDLPHTNCFTLDSHFEIKKFGENYRCHCPDVIPIEPDKILHPDIQAAELAGQTFYSPVKNEATIEEVEEEDSDR